MPTSLPALQGLAVAAATREAAKRKREAAEDASSQGSKTPKRSARPIPIISHEVAVPKGYDAAARNLDPALYGAHSTLAGCSYPFCMYLLMSRMLPPK